MTSLKLQSHVGNDHTLKLDLPSDFTDCDVDVVIAKSTNGTQICKEQDLELIWEGNPPRDKEGLTWVEFLRRSAGSWEGEFPERDQGEYEIRAEMP
jgi:hypothetical protein